MVDRITFMETLRSVQEIANLSQKPMSRKEIQSYFRDMELSGEQQEMIYQYLQTPKTETGEWRETDQHSEAAQAEANVHKKAEVKNNKNREGKKELSYSRHFRMYLEEVSAIPDLTVEQKQVLYQRLLTGEESVIEALSADWQREIIDLAKGRHTASVLLEDLVQEGNLRLLLGLRQLMGKAAEYGAGEYGKGWKQGLQRELDQKLSGYIMEGMDRYQQELEGEADSQNTILAKVTLVYEASKVLAEENGTVPTVQELCEYTKIPPEEIADILALHEKAQSY